MYSPHVQCCDDTHCRVPNWLRDNMESPEWRRNHAKFVKFIRETQNTQHCYSHEDVGMAQVCLPDTTDMEPWLVDTGATCHVTPNNKGLRCAKTNRDKVVVGDGRECATMERGQLALSHAEDQGLILHVTGSFTQLARLPA